MSLPAPPRRALPLSVKLQVALRALGLRESEIDWSHEPALQLRAINDHGTDYDPPQHDPRFIEIRSRAAHKHITFTDNGTGRGDITAIAQARKVRSANSQHIARMQAKLGMNPAPAPKRGTRWPKRKFRGK